jgi:hypothetical protein
VVGRCGGETRGIRKDGRKRNLRHRQHDEVPFQGRDHSESVEKCSPHIRAEHYFNAFVMECAFYIIYVNELSRETCFAW